MHIDAEDGNALVTEGDPTLSMSMATLPPKCEWSMYVATTPEENFALSGADSQLLGTMGHVQPSLVSPP